MRLLVSVRSAEEVAPALQGAADIIDAKEPQRGSLGRVDSDVLRSIAAQVRDDAELSVAMGDYSSTAQVIQAINAVPLSARPVPPYLKLGFAGVDSGEQIVELLSAAQAAARAHPASPRIIAVAYADAALARTAEPAVVLQAARLAGCCGVLLDTHVKGGANLLRWMSPSALGHLFRQAREHRLLTAVAGGLLLEDLEQVARTAPDVVGFRSAACRGGRAGRVSFVLVQDLRRRLEELDSGFLQDSAEPSRASSRNA